MSKKLKLERIVWADHVSYERNIWRTLPEMADLTPTIVETVGWVVKERKNSLVICSTLSDSGAMTGEMCIIKGCIKKRTVIE